MTKKRKSGQLLEKPQFDFKVAEIHEPADNNDLENEIECPSCQNIMTLGSIYVSPYYGCDECDFCLYM